jgi:hypothetical protein
MIAHPAKIATQLILMVGINPQAIQILPTYFVQPVKVARINV